MGKDADAALAFMAGLIGGFNQSSTKAYERKQKKQQDEEDRQWREFQKKQYEIDNQYREEQAHLTREEQARDNARQERQWSTERVDRLTDKQESRDFQLQLETMNDAERAAYRREQQQWREEGRKESQTQKELMGVAGEIDDLRAMYFTPEDGWLDPTAEARYAELAQRRQQILSGQQQAAPGAKPSSMPSTQFDAHIMDLADEMGVDPKLARAVMMAESGGNPNAVSSAGAQGLFQLMPGTAKEMGVTDPFNPEQNAKGGISYLAKLYKMTGGNLDQTLAAYNWGIGNVQKKGMGAMPKETQDYLPKVKGLMGTSPADNSFVSNLAQGSGLAPKKLTSAQKKELLLKIEMADDQIKTIEMSGNTSPAALAEKERLIKVKEGFQGQIAPELNPPAPEPTAAPGATNVPRKPQDNDPQAGYNLPAIFGDARQRAKEDWTTRDGQTVHPGSSINVMKAMQMGLMQPQDKTAAYRYLSENNMGVGADNPMAKYLQQFGPESGEAIYPTNPIDPTGLGVFAGVGGPGMLKPPTSLFFGGGRGAGMGWQAEKSFAEAPIPEMFAGAGARPASGAWNMGGSAAQQALPHLPPEKVFQGVREAAMSQSPTNPLSWLDNYAPPAPRPPLQLPAPPPQGSVIPMPGPAPLPYNVSVNPMDIELLKQYLNSQRLGY